MTDPDVPQQDIRWIRDRYLAAIEELHLWLLERSIP